MNKSITIKDVAKLAGVGTSSVSRFYNGGYVSDVTKKKIEAAIEELNYQPNLVAKALKGKSSELAVIVERINSNTGSRFIQEFSNYADDLGYSTCVYTSRFDDAKRISIVDKLIERGVKKIFILPYSDLNYGHKDKIIIVGQKSKYYNSIYYDEYNAINTILATSKDAKKICICGYDVNDIALAKRVEYVVNYCKEKLIPYETEFIEFDRENYEFRISENTFYFCMTDTIAQMIYFQSRIQGIDVKVAGVGDYGLSKQLGITSIDNMYEHVAHVAINMIDNEKTVAIESVAKLR